MQIRSLLFAVTLCSLFACQEDLTTEKATWAASTTEWKGKLDAIKKGHDGLQAKMKELPDPLLEELKAEKAAFEKRVATGGVSIAASEKAIEDAKATVDRLISQGKRVPVEVALSNTRNTVDGILARADSLVSAANSDLDTLKKKTEEARKSGESAAARTAAWTAEMKKKGGTVLVGGVGFTGEGLDVSSSSPALASLAAALASCPELKVDLAVVAAGDAADLGTKRAEALKAHLNSAAVAKVAGSLAKDGEESVTVSVTTPCK